MDTERVFTAATFQFTQEDNFIIHLLNGNIVVLDTLEALLHFVQFMVVRSKQCTCFGFRMLMDMLHNRPGDRNTVVGRCTSSQLIKEHQAARRQVIQDICCLIHLYHKCRFSNRNIIAGTHTSEYLIHQANMRTLSRYEATDLCQQRYQSRLPQQCRLTSHIRTGNDNDLLRTAIQHHIIGNIFFPYRKLLLNNRMASLANIQYIVIFNNRTYIVILTRHIGKGKQAVQTCYLVCIDLDGRDKLT